jgi:hypothetical protein
MGGSLDIPTRAELGEYSLRISWKSWCLDSTPFEIAERGIVELTRKLLRASIMQAQALEVAEGRQVDDRIVIKLGDEIESLYEECGEFDLARLTWIDIATALQSAGMAAASREAESRATKIGRAADNNVGITLRADQPSISTDREGQFQSRWYVDFGYRTFRDQNALDLPLALQWRLSHYHLHVSDHAELRRRLFRVGEKIRHLPVRHSISESRKRGSASWALQRLTSHVLSGLLSDLVVYRIEGLPRTTAESLDAALDQSSSIFKDIDRSRGAATVYERIVAFASALRQWSAIEGGDTEAQTRRDTVWRDLRLLRERIARSVARSHADLTGALPSAAVIISPYVEVAIGETELVETAVAVSRVATRLELAASGQ